FRREELTPEQQKVFDQIAAPRAGAVPAPFHILLESPNLASLTQALGAFCRYRTGFAPHLSELMVLITAAHWRADYEFSVHISEARKAGLSEETIAAVRDGRVPRFDDPDSQLIIDPRHPAVAHSGDRFFTQSRFPRFRDVHTEFVICAP